MNKAERNKCILRICAFVKRNKRGQLRTREEVIDFLDIELSCYTKHHLTFHNRFRKMYGKAFAELFTQFTVLIYFPYHNNALICSRERAENIPYLMRILSKTFEEKAITFKYCICGQVFTGPQIIISLGNPHTIVLEDGKFLGSCLEEY